MMAIPWASLRFRLIAAAAIGLVVGLLAASWLLIAVYRDSETKEFETDLATRLRVVVASADVDQSGHLLVDHDIGDPRFDTTYSGWYWQISSAPEPGRPAAVLAHSDSLFDWVLAIPESSATKNAFVPGPSGQKLRITRLRVTLPRGPVPYDVIVAGNFNEVTARVGLYIGTLSLALALLATIMLLALIVQVVIALSPMNNVRRALAAVGSGKAETLVGRFPVEVEPLITELNALLLHNKALLERARTQVGNLAHALKTPLTVLRNEVSQGDSGQLREAALRETDTMRRQVDHYLARARAAAAANVLHARAAILPRADGLVRTMGKIHRNIDFELSCPPDLAFRGEAQDLDEILGNLLDNGGKWADSRVEVSVTLADQKIRITVDDDGPGLDAKEQETVLTRGQRLDEDIPGSGLGLSIVRDLVGLYGGDFALERSALGGLRVALSLPAASQA